MLKYGPKEQLIAVLIINWTPIKVERAHIVEKITTPSSKECFHVLWQLYLNEEFQAYILGYLPSLMGYNTSRQTAIVTGHMIHRSKSFYSIPYTLA